MSVKVNTELLLQILEETPSDQNIMLFGHKGIGKSQILENYYSSKGYKVVAMFLGQMSDPGDLIGIPYKNEETGHTDFLPPYWFPTDNQPIVLFLDELNRARPEILQSVMDLALNRKLAGKSLPEGSRIISAVNYGEEYQVTELDPALVSRFNIYEFVPAVSEWVIWAQKNGVDERIVDFINSEPSALDNHTHADDLENLDKTPDRRAWVRVSDIIKGKELTAARKQIIAGIIGGYVVNRFAEYCNKNHLITAKELLSEKNKTVIEKKLSHCSVPEFALINDSVFAFLEAEKQNEFIETAAENLCFYFDFMYAKKINEATAHFANLFSSTNHPNALMFILEHCPELYSSVTKYVSSLKDTPLR